MSPLPDLDRWVADPAVRTRHERTAAASAGELWAAARAVRLDDTGTLGGLVRWRIPGTPPDRRFQELFATAPFTVLAEGEHWSVSGLCGRIWTLARDYPRVDAERFARWDRPGTVRVVFAHGVRPAGDGRSTLVSEARVAPVDRRARFALRSLWLAVGRFEALIGAEPLELAVRRAEGRGR
ncbi:hypothetical protein [Paraconexibacter algicola]|uniref:hypothetical protein n=1 Tax=Paraconexibacter algicola TaxID=2133960 RepID=UPI0011B22C02|nr:hypothetical protein [Paraconexibacter algicola]